jgi:predicted N-acetyltransferase YhbS
VAFDEHGELVGSLQSWPLALTQEDGQSTPLWLVGPIAVVPERRGKGIARAMLRRALAAIDETGIPAVLIGDLDYYGPFGFSAETTGGWSLPGPVERHRLLARLDEGHTVPAWGILGARR